MKILKKKYYGCDVNGHRGVAKGEYDSSLLTTPELKIIKGKNPNLKDLSINQSQHLPSATFKDSKVSFLKMLRIRLLRM